MRFVLDILALAFLVGGVCYIVGKEVWNYFAGERPRGQAASPKGLLDGPSDNHLRRARKFYAGDLQAPMIGLELISVDGEGVPPIPCPVAEGDVVTLIGRRYGSFKVRIQLVVPRPTPDGVTGDTRFQYIGLDLSSPAPGWRCQFDHAMIWAVDHPSPKADDAA